MQGQVSQYEYSKSHIAFILLSAIILLIYSNTFKASWQFDDYPNILQNPNLKIENLYPQTLFRTFFVPHPDEQQMRRPIASLTFAINWYIGKDKVVGYHAVNISIHILTAFLLFLTVRLLFSAPNPPAALQDEASRNTAALLTAVLWAASPVQTQAVTYIVQRMASLAAMFYLAGVYFYIRTRLKKGLLGQILYAVLCLASFLLAVGSKENAILLPPALMLVEIIFFQNISDWNKKQFSAAGVLIGSILFILILYIFLHFFLKSSIESILKGYEGRPFTLAERIMTQPRVLTLYLNQIFFPNAEKLSLMHDIPLSTSLFAPWTTLPAMLFIFMLIGFSISSMVKRPAVSFAILFFFLNHLVESTVIPLEMVYEHRNYLPSMFLFLPVSIAIINCIFYFRSRPVMKIFTASAAAAVLIIMGIAAHARNEAWQTEASLWSDTYEKAPGLARPAHNLGEIYSKSGQYKEAMALYNQALNAVDMRDNQKALTYYNMGNIFQRIGAFPKAAELYQKALAVMPEYNDALFNLALVQIEMKTWIAASDTLDKLVSFYPRNSEYYALKGAVLLKRAKIEMAVSSLKRALESDPFNAQANFYAGVAYSLSGNYQKADRTLMRALKYSPENIFAHLWLIENRMKWADREYTEKAVDLLFDRFSINRILKEASVSSNPFLADFSTSSSLTALLEESLRRKAEQIGKTAQSEEHD